MLGCRSYGYKYNVPDPDNKTQQYHPAEAIYLCTQTITPIKTHPV